LIIWNSSASLDINDEALRYEPTGNPVDVAMLNHLFEAQVDVPAKMADKEHIYPCLTMIPFSPMRKRTLVVHDCSKLNEGEDQMVRIIIKGAPEYIMPMCNSMLNGNCEAEEFGDEKIQDYLTKIEELIDEQEKDVFLKPITYAYKDMLL
jgi:magnesium-transporting ATPase (P-type)